MKGIARVAVIAAVAGLLVPGPAASACATEHVQLSLSGFPPPIGEFGPLYLYWVEEPAEGDGTVELTIRADPDGSCPTPARPAQAQYTVDTPLGTPRPATAGPADYDAILLGNTGPLWDDRGSPNQHTFPVTIHSDLLIEPVAEQALARITATDGKPMPPQEAPLWIIDSDGLSRASLETGGPYSQEEQYREVVVPVFRAGDASQPLSVDYTVDGSADAPATPGTDFTVTSPQPLEFGVNERVKLITVSLVADGISEPTEEATVSLALPGVDPNDPTSATIELLDSAGGAALPTASLHHPRQGLTYRADDYRLREVHVFTKQGGGGAVAEAKLAIRMNRKNGSCAWLARKRFRNGPCDQTRWISSDGQYEPDFFYFRMRELQPSTGKIRDYTAFAEAIDESGSEDSVMEKGRNANTFEVRAPKKRRAAGR
jgi:hypothetical protein